jgi:hypothetical protein
MYWPSLEHAYNTLQFQSSGNHQQQGTHSAPANTMPAGNSAGRTYQLSTNQYTRNVTEIQIRTPHVELPIFTREAPRAWLLECEDIFNLVQIPQENRVQWGIAHIRGQAKTWLSSSGFHV